MAYNQYDALNTSLGKTSSLTEIYIPLWYYSNGTVSTTATSGSSYILKGGGMGNTTAARLHTLNSNWAPSQNFAFEASFFSNATGTGYTSYAALYDFNANALVNGSTISVASPSTNPSFVLVRSGSITLVPGHTYGITIWISNASYNVQLTKAALIALLS